MEQKSEIDAKPKTPDGIIAELVEELRLALVAFEQLAEHKSTCDFYQEIPKDFAECGCGLFDIVAHIKEVIEEHHSRSIAYSSRWNSAPLAAPPSHDTPEIDAKIEEIRKHLPKPGSSVKSAFYKTSEYLLDTRDVEWLLTQLQASRHDLEEALASEKSPMSKLQAEQQKNAELRHGVGWCYQLAGLIGQPVYVLDNLSALANGQKTPHEWKAAESDLESANKILREELEAFPCNCYANANGWKCGRCAALGKEKAK